MSIVMDCQLCGEPAACHEVPVEDDGAIWLCDGCRSDSGDICSGCGVMADISGHDDFGFPLCCGCEEKEHMA
ncbi:hypothetical protein [Photobacterium halotolerans]|uniref:hypothetical protein n=1 Tax=Photobacterium halotolerans TaxID=265726 RepID=UPI001373690A|nr:hypothetical protein [Photobacterium halotolerans]NAW86512.1 hypothetical protein [Photobacterium halotolerans]